MRTRSAAALPFALAVALMPVASLPVAAQSEDTDIQAVRTVLESLATYAQAGNLDAMGSLYAPGRGVHIIEGAGVNHGWEDYRDHHLAPELASFENFEYRYFSIEPVVRRRSQPPSSPWRVGTWRIAPSVTSSRPTHQAGTSKWRDGGPRSWSGSTEAGRSSTSIPPDAAGRRGGPPAPTGPERHAAQQLIFSTFLEKASAASLTPSASVR